MTASIKIILILTIAIQSALAQPVDRFRKLLSQDDHLASVRLLSQYGEEILDSSYDPSFDELNGYISMCEEYLKTFPECYDNERCSDIIFNRTYLKVTFLSTAWAQKAIRKGSVGDYFGSISDIEKAIEIKELPDHDYLFVLGFATVRSGQKAAGCRILSKSFEMGNSMALEVIQMLCK